MFQVHTEVGKARAPRGAWLPVLVVLLAGSAWAQGGNPAEPVSGAGASSVSQYAVVPGARELEATLLAPCCWNQTLDNHNSDLAAELRREIRARLLAGEDVESVRRALVSQYGEKMVALPEDSPLGTVALLLSAGVGVAGLLAGWAIIRWRRRTDADAPDPSSTGGSASGGQDEWDRALDEELENDSR